MKNKKEGKEGKEGKELHPYAIKLYFKLQKNKKSLFFFLFYVSNCKKFFILRLQAQKSSGTLRLTYRGLSKQEFIFFKLFFLIPSLIHAAIGAGGSPIRPSLFFFFYYLWWLILLSFHTRAKPSVYLRGKSV